jgi:hypothetical protein
MLDFMRGRRPDITPAQAVASLPVLATLGHVVGLYELSKEKRETLEKTIPWTLVLIGADTFLRIGRNVGGRRVWDELADSVEGGFDLLTPPTEEELAEAERLEMTGAETEA